MDKSSIMVDMIEESNKEREANERLIYPYGMRDSGVQFSAAPYPNGAIAPPTAMQGVNMQPPPYSPSQNGNILPDPLVINIEGLNKPGAPDVGKIFQSNGQVLEKFPVETPPGNPPVWKKVSVRTRCTNCSSDQFTRVDSRVSSNGKTWAILCFCFGSWLLSLLVLCMDGFKKYHHFCSSCNAQLGVYRPKMKGDMIVLLVLLTLVILTVQVVVVVYCVWPLMQEECNYSLRSFCKFWGFDRIW